MCPDHQAWVQRIEARLDPEVAIGSRVLVEVEIEDNRDSVVAGPRRRGFLGHLRLRSVDGEESRLVRDYRARDCGLLVDALALAVALMVDPGAAGRASVGPTTQKRQVEGYVRLDGRVEVGVKPSFGGGPGLVVGFIRGAWRSELRLGFDISRWIVDDARLRVGSMAAIRPALGVLTLRLCRELLPRTPYLDLPICGGFEIGLLSTRTIDTGTAQAAGDSRSSRWSIWPAAELGLSLQWQLPRLRSGQTRREERPRWFVSFELTGVIPVFRARRTLDPAPELENRATLAAGHANDDKDKSLYETGPVGARAGVGMEMRFR